MSNILKKTINKFLDLAQDKTPRGFLLFCKEQVSFLVAKLLMDDIIHIYVLI